MDTMHRRLAPSILALALVAAAGRGAGAQDPPAANPDAAALADFQERVQAYAALHDKLERTLAPIPPNPTPEQVSDHQRALERLLLRARAGAKHGDIFTDSIRAYFRRQIARVIQGSDGAAVRQALLDEDTRGVRFAVNARYPANVPRSTVPPQILLVLPRLPEEVEYRFVGERLVLLDVHANTVVDFIDRALS